MTRTRALMAAALGLFVALWWIAVIPASHGDTLDNGLTISCAPDSNVHATCIIGGCERVNGDHVIDAIHVAGLNSGDAPIFAGDALQTELPFKCINPGTTARYGLDTDFKNGRRNPDGSLFNVRVQGCRKNTFGSDDCGPWSNYAYKPPVMSNQGAPIKCTGAPATPQGEANCPQSPANPQSPAKQTATVVGGGATVYSLAHDEVPDPATGVHGVQLGWVLKGGKVQLVQPCTNGWCMIVWQKNVGFVKQSSLQFG